MTNGYDIVVAGAGLAGMTAGLTSARLGRSVIVLTGGIPGGLLLGIERIEGLPGPTDGIAGYDLLPNAQELAEEAGAQISAAAFEGIADADGGWAISSDSGTISCRSVILATGASFRPLGIAGEERLRGKGVSHCASCDGPLFRGRDAVVIGGGDSALQEALTLAEIVRRVVLLVRDDNLSGQASLRARASAHPSIEIRYRTVIEEFVGDDALTSVRIRHRPTGAVENVGIAAAFPFVGLVPNSDPFAGWLECDPGGRVITDSQLQTSQAGVFAAGLVRDGSTARAVATAGEGATAAIAAHRHLETQGLPASAG